jgi:eukaryotic-like serine/threonine-protein kinase
MRTLNTVIGTFFSVKAGVIALALVLVYVSPLPDELLIVDQFIYELAGGQSMAVDPASTLISPYWFNSAEQILWILLVCFLIFFLPLLGMFTGSLISLLLVTVLLVVQVAGQTRMMLWLPQGVVIQFVLLTSPIILLWAKRARAWRRILSERDRALIELASFNVQQGQLEKAFDRLKRCEPSEQLKPLGYELALQQERRRSFAAAATTYQWLQSFAPHYKDVADRVASLQSSNAPKSFDTLAATHTLALSVDEHRNPELGRYRIERELGRGAMGVVFLGVDPKIARKVAIKTLSYQLFPEKELSEVKKRFFREAEAAGRLTHPNIVTIYDVGEEPDLSFIAMDYIEGESLAHYISDDNLLPIEKVYHLIAQVADALGYAHQQKIVHRDIKPGNLMYNHAEDQIKVADFGIARITDDSCTKTGDILGSPLYMSPEQLKGDRVSGATDIYSLGVTLYQLLTGAFPFSGDSIANLAYQILHKKYKSVRDLRPQLPVSAVRIVNKAMAKDPAKRFEDAGAMAISLRKALDKDFGVA